MPNGSIGWSAVAPTTSSCCCAVAGRLRAMVGLLRMPRSPRFYLADDRAFCAIGFSFTFSHESSTGEVVAAHGSKYG
jgi:hypothetical protein